MISLITKSLVACAATVLLCSTALTQQSVQARSVSYELNIPAENLDAALQALALASHHKLLYRAELVAGKASPVLVGTYTTEEAVTRLLDGTKLSFEITPASVVLIKGIEDTPVGPSARVSPDQNQAPTAKEEPGKSSQDFRVAQNSVAQVDKGNTGPQVNQTKDKADQGPSKDPNAGLAEILVKGSRIMNVDVVRTEDDPQPYTIFDSAKIEQSGATNVEDFLKQQLTMNTTAGTNSQGVNLHGATSSINLRGLGTNETLILIDGRRSAGVTIGASPGQPDINGIPLAAIERIEVLPSSASAIYGGAAVGGVVNIILKRNFTGGELRFTYDKPTSSSADQRTVGGTYGTSFFEGRTQIMLGGQYADGSPLLEQDRLALVGRGVSTILNNGPSYLYNPFQPFSGATPNIGSADGTYNADFTVFTPTPLTLRNGAPLNSAITSIPVGTAPGANLSTGLLANAGKYNLSAAPGNGTYGLQSPLGTVPTTKSIFATIRQTIFDDVQLFSEFMTSSNSSRANENPFSSTFAIPSSAPTNPFQQDVYVTFPSTATATLTSDSVTQSATVGLIAPLAHGWTSELDYTWSRNSFKYSIPNVDATAFGSALSDGTVSPFVDTNKYPLILNRYIAPETFSGDATLNDLGLRASGTVGTLPAGNPALTIGLEHRKEGSGNANDQIIYPLTPANNIRAMYFGQSQSTESLYAEAVVPLIAPRNQVPAIHSLDLQIAGRSERYTVDAGTPFAVFQNGVLAPYSPPQGAHSTINYTSTNPTIGLKYEPVTDIILRASYSTAFLPPLANQLLPNPTPVCGSPCATIVDPKNGESYDVNYSSGGNPSLRPQTSKNWDFGLIWEPQEMMLRGLRMDLEYYKITQPNYIAYPSLQQLVSDPAFASHVTRDSMTGRITLINDSPVNAIEYKTSGWDLKVDYLKSTRLGTLGVHAAGTLIRYDLRQYSVGSPYLDYLGFPSEGGEGKIKANATLDWRYSQWTVAWVTTYFSNYRQFYSPGSPGATQYGASTLVTDAQGGYTIPSQIYHDIYASYLFDGGAAGRILSNVTVTFGIKNVFNTLPPFDANFQPYFYSFYGDPRLRDVRLSVKKTF